MTKNQTVKERLLEYLSFIKVSVYSFEKKCGLSNGYVRNISKSIQPDKIEIISMNYTNLNTGWLLTGEGSMIKEQTYSTREEAIGKAKEEETKGEKCLMCAEKDKRIETLEMLLETQKNLVDTQKNLVDTQKELVNTQKELIEQLKKGQPEMNVCLKRV